MIQLGHLYEHIFCMHMSKFFREHGLFPYLDYSLDGKTYHGGVIVVDIELYSDKAIELSTELPEASTTFNKDTVLLALSQLVAEKQEPFGSESYDVLEKALYNIDKQPWQPIDTVGLIDTKRQRRQAGPLYITDGAPLPAHKLITSVLLDTEFAKTHRNLLPLFRQLAWLIVASLQETIANTHGYYSFDDKYVSNTKTIAIRNIFNVANTREVDIDVTEVAETCTQTIKDLQRAYVFEKFLIELQNTSYYERSQLSPNIERTYEDTLILVGSKGWQELASEANYHTLLEHMSVEVKSGRQKIETYLPEKPKQ